MEAERVKVYDALIRVSKTNGRKPSDDSTMTTDQEAAITRAIAEAGGRRGKTFEAYDQSGFTIHESDVYPGLLERVRSGRSVGFVVAYGDRLSRNWHTVGKFFDDLEAVGAEYIDASSPEIDYRTDEGRMLTGMKAVMGEVPSLTARRRGKRIADQTVARGVPNAVPYGYRRNADRAGVKSDPERDAKSLVPDKTTAPIVRRIFQLRLDGHRLASIVRILDEAGIPSPRGKYWTHGSVETIVKNEGYTGVVKLGARRLEGAHEALVSKRDWRRVQGTRVVSHSGRFKAGVAGGLMECSGCGRPLSVAGHEGRLSYACRRKTTNGHCPRPVYVAKKAADEYVDRALRAAVRLGGALGVVASARELDALREAAEQAQAERKAFAKFFSAVDADDFLIGYEERKRRETEAMQAYDEKLDDAREAEEFPGSESAYEALDFAHKRRFASRVIEQIIVSPSVSGSRPRDVSERFDLRWRGAGQEPGTTR